jgi:hypothetical protein
MTAPISCECEILDVQLFRKARSDQKPARIGEIFIKESGCYFCLTFDVCCARSTWDDNRGDWAAIATFFGLFATHELHQFGLCLAPILGLMVIGPVAKLIDLVSAGPYLLV